MTGVTCAYPRKIIVAPDPEALAETAAERILARIADAGQRAAVCLTGGSSPEGLYRRLACEPFRGRVPWQRVHWFMGDDRFVPENHPLSNMGMARRLFLDYVDVPPGNIRPIPTCAGSPDEAARRYEAELKRFYGSDRLDPARPLFDLVLMGLGDDGHTASLFPNAPALNEKTHWVVGVEDPGLAPFVPRVTLTLPVLASSREILFLVGGEGKREVLARVLSGSDLPASCAYCEGDLVFLVDRAAAP
jgi:6-phosphogluconolactonase